jgi:hypothetical protein
VGEMHLTVRKSGVGWHFIRSAQWYWQLRSIFDKRSMFFSNGGRSSEVQFRLTRGRRVSLPEHRLHLPQLRGAVPTRRAKQLPIG